MAGPAELNPARKRIKEVKKSAPRGFIFPPRLFEVIADDANMDIDPWMYLSYITKWTKWWKRTLAEQFPERQLVPFAKHQGSDDVFCFDANDRSGNPAVHIIHSFTTPGWEYRGKWQDFDTWLSEANEVHAQWVKEEEEYSNRSVENTQ